MYTAGDAGNSIDEYDLSTAWDLSTALYLQEFATAERGVRGLWMREDGKFLVISDGAGNAITSLILSTAWDITTAVFSGNSFSHANLNGIAFSRDGVYGFICGPTAAELHRFTMTSVFRISTMASQVTFKVLPTIGVLDSVFFKANGTMMFVLAGTKIRRYLIKRGWR